MAIRRGDALGFRTIADYFADQLAPGLSNGTSDARWISILSWCLKWSHIAWQNAGGANLDRRNDQRARYAWLRPLELLWVARTLESGQTTGQLRGRRSIERWRKSDMQLPDFAMSADQFRRYRQVGTYGAYRVLFRTIPGLTTGDGWTPGQTALNLAEFVNKSLFKDAQLNQEHFEKGIKWENWRDGNESRFWLERGWKEWMKLKKKDDFLPTPDNNVRTQLLDKECQLLKPVLFGNDSVLQMTAKILAKAMSARSHHDLCNVLANSKDLSKKVEPALLVLLPVFSQLADTAMDAMREIWRETNHNNEKQTPTLNKLLECSDNLVDKLAQLKKVSEVWLKTTNRDTFPHGQVVSQLAEAMKAASKPLNQLQALIKHHHEHGGGRRWFREQEGKLEPLVKDTGITASDYRFRLRSLCLLASQCGVADMSHALGILTDDRFGEKQAIDEQLNDENGDNK